MNMYGELNSGLSWCSQPLHRVVYGGIGAFYQAPRGRMDIPLMLYSSIQELQHGL